MFKGQESGLSSNKYAVKVYIQQRILTWKVIDWISWLYRKKLQMYRRTESNYMTEANRWILAWALCRKHGRQRREENHWSSEPRSADSLRRLLTPSPYYRGLPEPWTQQNPNTTPTDTVEMKTTSVHGNLARKSASPPFAVWNVLAHCGR